MEIKIDKQIFVSVSVSGVINFFYPLFSYLVFTDWVCLRVEAQCRITFKKFQVVAVVAAEISDGAAIAASALQLSLVPGGSAIQQAGERAAAGLWSPRCHLCR